MLYRAPLDTPLTAPRGHIPALDAVRGLAILLVTAFRFREGPGGDLATRAGRQMLDYGHFGVDLFFVLSGFLITGILFDAKGQENYFRNFYLRRTLRIFPLYYAVLVLTLIVLPSFLPRGSSVFSESSPYGWWLWLYGANLAQCWHQDWILGPYNHFWSLAIEEHFYLVWPLAIYRLNRQQGLVACVICIVIGFVSKVAVLLLFPTTVVPAEVFTLCRLDALGMGGFLALAMRGPGGFEWLMKWHRPALIVAGSLLAVALGAKQVLKHVSPQTGQIVYWMAFTPISALGAIFILKAVASAPGSWTTAICRQSTLQRAGKYSYGWYVFQGLIVADLTHYVPNELLLTWSGGMPAIAMALRIFIGGGISLALAVVSWHCFEKQCLAWKPRHTPLPMPVPVNSDRHGSEGEEEERQTAERPEEQRATA
jgi:peptidoglycan/LPS O-acetylase OafA/YrhL